MNKKELLELVKELPSNVVLHIHVNVEEASASNPADGKETVRYRVETEGKKNSRVKIRPQPNPSVSEVGIATDGQVLTGDGYQYNGFAKIDKPLAGWVELEYLIKL